jgi:dehydrodolichyl diphosphate syntase complex subunit NUS1
MVGLANTSRSHLPDNKGVNYQVFLRALYNFAKVEMRLGR